jgi:hypothetical protein
MHIPTAAVFKGLVLAFALVVGAHAGAPPRTHNVGHLNSIAARASGLISSATGSFDNIAPANLGAAGTWSNTPNVPDAFTLQLNSQPFDTALCSTGNASCKGWQQFIYSRYQCLGGCVFIEYWLLNFGSSQGKTCPVDWTAADNHCYRNGPKQVLPPTLAPVGAADLLNVKLTATAAGGPGGTDTVTLTKAGISVTATAPNWLGLNLQWREVEWNVVGDCCASQVDLQPASTVAMLARVTLVDGTQNAPTCVVAVTSTAETNSLDFGPTAPVASGAGPAMIFSQSNGGGTLPNCAAATSFGDTHLGTFQGLLYDFQATGDFVLAQIDNEFVVHARQVKRADRWPDASVNQAVAARFGKHRVAICPRDGSPLVVDGQRAELGDGKAMPLHGQASVRRRGNVYLVQSPQGHSLRAEINDGWINATIGMGRWPAPVQGLLASVRADKDDSRNHQLRGRDGAPLATPLDFKQLYGAYAEGWRVGEGDELLKDCGDQPAARGIPGKAFGAEDLPGPERERARAACVAAGVKLAGFLEACTLDVAVIGDVRAAQFFARLPAPDAVASITGGTTESSGSGPALRHWGWWMLALGLLVALAWAWRRRKAP